MSMRAKLASVAASIGVLAIGWQVGTADGQTVATTPTTTTTSTATTRVTTGTTSSSTQTSTTGTQSTTSSSSTSTSTATAASSGSTYTDGTYTGTTSSNRYGSVTVKVTISGGKITAINATANANDGHSQRINSQAIPVLKSETLSAQSADISTVSGATYTTDSYLTSLQSALDQAQG